MEERVVIEDLGHGVALVDDEHDTTLVVDGEDVWCDRYHEPEDMLLCRDLRIFVETLARLVAERAALREAAQTALARCPLGCTEESYCGRCEPLLAVLSEPARRGAA